MQYEGLAAGIADYINQRRLQKLEPIEKALEKALKDVEDVVQQAQINTDFLPQIQQINQQFDVRYWLDDAAKRAKQISLVTHALKFTHGDAKGSSVLSLEYTADADYLVTASLTNLAIDAVGNAAALDVAKLLQLESEGQSLAQALTDGDFSALAVFSENQEQLTEWVEGFKLALADKALSSHTLAKQLYFPAADGQYHLLSPVFATSLAHQFNGKITAVRYGDEPKATREARKAGKYYDKSDVRFLDTAIQSFGGSKPQNISQLNSQRGGKTHLLNCSPPSWQSTLKPPLNEPSIFSGREFNRRVWRDLQELQRYLLSVKGRDSTLEIRRNIAAFVNDLIDGLLNYAAEVQGLTEHAGWSQQDCTLNPAEQLWLDVWCEDLQFQQKRANNNWQQDICLAFAGWLNNKLNYTLKKDGLVFGTVQYQHWAKLLSPRLRDYEIGTSVFSVGKSQAEVAV
ncbi:type I-F CRISPR-associated protein Csy1 [Alkalimonas mucilaginosa]|uniref:Type I-F CRISPR-associated protein Csy1 n=1 Tax=Alkalimonas mucilaginosa TaxID=3057676 RepID=A0ABU7JIF1_9GAMM|nr:type I-F CRISPR-associated protein Csy1 [Alkalimonas sp. MEB004]MEE2025484.1 type I-F CRISPR-associated protein Csy1 [Alkalimonas sp. MEB004]